MITNVENVENVEISSEGIQPLASKVESLIGLEEPNGYKELRRVMG